MRTAFATIPARRPQAADLPRRLRLLRPGLRLEVIGAIQVVDLRGAHRRRRSPTSSTRCGRRACRPSSAPRCSPARCSSRSATRPASATSTCCATTTCPASPATPSTRWLGLMRFDYVTMTEALGGDAAALDALDLTADRPRRGASTRSERPVPRRVLLAASTASRAATARDPVLDDVDLDVGAGRLPRRRGPVRRGQDHPAAGAARRRSAHRRVGVERRPGLRVGYVPQVETVDWSFPVTVGRVRAAWPAPRPPAARGRPPPSGRDAAAVLDRLGIGDLGRPPHPRAVRRPAAAGVPGPGPAAASPTCCCSTSPPSGVDLAPATRSSTCSPTCTPTGWPSCSPPTTSTAWPPTCPDSSASTGGSSAVGPPAEVLTPTCSSAPTARRSRCSSTPACPSSSTAARTPATATTVPEDAAP